MTDINQRFKLIRAETSLSQAAFADIFGVSPAHISRIETGKGRPSNQLIKAVCRVVGLHEEWLLYGKGEMFDPEKEFTEEQSRKLDQDLLEIHLEADIERLNFANRILTQFIKQLDELDFNLYSGLPSSNRKYIKLINAKKELKKTAEDLIELITH